METPLPPAHRSGLLVIGHGTRDPRGQAEFLATVAALASRCPDRVVEPGFLEIARPTIAEGIERLVSAGVTSCTAAPLLLFAAGHAKIDVPSQINAAASQYPQVQFRQAGHLGCHPRLLELSVERFLAARGVGREGGLEHLSELSPGLPEDKSCVGETLLVVVGRGSRDVEAIDETRRYAALLAQRLGVAAVRTAFLAMATPSWDEFREDACRLLERRAVVVPHLLFRGELLSTLGKLVEAAAVAEPWRDWRLADHLGPSPAVVDAILDRVAEVENG